MRSVDILRAIGDIDDKHIEEAMPFVYKKKKEFNVFKYMPAFFGLFLVVFIGTKLVNQEETMIVNPIVTYQTLKEAEDSVGFDFSVDLSDFDNLTYSTIDNEILEIVNYLNKRINSNEKSIAYAIALFNKEASSKITFVFLPCFIINLQLLNKCIRVSMS